MNFLRYGSVLFFFLIDWTDLWYRYPNKCWVYMLTPQLTPGTSTNPVVDQKQYTVGLVVSRLPGPGLEPLPVRFTVSDANHGTYGCVVMIVENRVNVKIREQNKSKKNVHQRRKKNSKLCVIVKCKSLRKNIYIVCTV